MIIRSCNATTRLIPARHGTARRLQFAGAVYHVTSRGNARQKIFFNDADRELFLKTLAHVVSRYRWICHAYCLMANHYHLLIETPKANLSIGMRQLNRPPFHSLQVPQRAEREYGSRRRRRNDRESRQIEDGIRPA